MILLLWVLHASKLGDIVGGIIVTSQLELLCEVTDLLKLATSQKKFHGALWYHNKGKQFI